MLNNEAKENLELIYETAEQLWGSNCTFSELEIKNSPWSEFEQPVCLYGKVDVGIYYDRSALDIGIKQNGKYELLSKFTSENVFRGMTAMQAENLLHNFKVLDKVAKRL